MRSKIKRPAVLALAGAAVIALAAPQVAGAASSLYPTPPGGAQLRHKRRRLARLHLVRRNLHPKCHLSDGDQ